MKEEDGRKRPTKAVEYGPCAVCGETGFPKFDEFLCSDHNTFKHSIRVRFDEGVAEKYSEMMEEIPQID